MFACLGLSGRRRHFIASTIEGVSMSETVAVVVCTKDRPDALNVCLAAVAEQSQGPDLTLVVDSSASRPEWYGHGPADFPWPYKFLPSEAGLTIQRNVALSFLAGEYDFVLFLDDDSVPARDYVAEVVRAFREHPEAAGVAGRIANLPPHVERRVETLMGIDGPSGSLLHSGVNILNRAAASGSTTEWASGCCMSFRSSAIAGLGFDECRNGNGVGEDVDFCVRASARGPLVFWDSASVDHVQSPVNRDSAARTARRDVIHRWKLAEEGLGGVSKSAVLSSILANGVRQSARALRHRSMSPVRTSIAQVQGLSDVLIRRRHTSSTMYQ